QDLRSRNKGESNRLRSRLFHMLLLRSSDDSARHSETALLPIRGRLWVSEELEASDTPRLLGHFDQPRSRDSCLDGSRLEEHPQPGDVLLSVPGAEEQLVP